MFETKEILRAAQGIAPYLTETYRLLHRHPEVAHREAGTNRLLRAELDRLGVSYLAPADNITIAVLDSNLPGPCVGLRCDTDALPVQEETGLPYASENPGVMHACGHDAHMTTGLGTLRLLKEHMGTWRGRVKVIFQPAEEGEDGSDEVIATGLVSDVDVFFAIHVWSPFASGTLHVSPIVTSAAVNMFTIRLIGRGGHGATPEKCHDALVAGASLVTSLQSIVSRSLSPMEPAVLTIGSFHSGLVGNVITQEAEIKGTIRTLNEETRSLVENRLREITESTAAMFGCTAQIDNIRVSDAVKNDERAAALALACAKELVPEDKIGPQKTMMLGDNFANYGVIAPYCYAQVGIADEAKQTNFAHHNGRFRMDEDCLPLCAAWMTAFTVSCGESWRK